MNSNITKENAKLLDIWTESYTANGDLTDLENCAVAASSGASGEMEIKAPTGQGVWTMGILVSDTITDGLRGAVRRLGMAKARAAGSFNNGIELTVEDTTGRLSAAASGDYVIAYAREASTKIDQLVAVEVVPAYQKN